MDNAKEEWICRVAKEGEAAKRMVAQGRRVSGSCSWLMLEEDQLDPLLS